MILASVCASQEREVLGDLGKEAVAPAELEVEKKVAAFAQVVGAFACLARPGQGKVLVGVVVP